ncbi:GNAT family N-acetyltransferase [Epilithonimonas sp.]|uniref:GNAT family N-acetyltransferase n=1 Tax=Epilithonimonas sp. TaxID=2894511 RepID=UPI0028A95E3A|nr:GNAT family N-acetyltransferase [Epilithonimonas sp.]
MSAIQIRKVGLEDIADLQSIGRQTFAETFSEGNSEEDMNQYLEEKFSVSQLKSELSDENSMFYFAFVDKNIVGYLKVNSGDSQTEIKDKNAMEIERIYVKNDFHGKSVAKHLYNKAIEIAESKNVDYVWLGVWEENARAISFYRKNNFVEFDKHIFKLGNDEQTDIMMKLHLNK